MKTAEIKNVTDCFVHCGTLKATTKRSDYMQVARHDNEAQEIKAMKENFSMISRQYNKAVAYAGGTNHPLI